MFSAMSSYLGRDKASSIGRSRPLALRQALLAGKEKQAVGEQHVCGGPSNTAVAVRVTWQAHA